MQKTLSKNIDNEIKQVSQRLKILLAMKRGISIKELEEERRKKNRYPKNQYLKHVFHFQCPRCYKFNTKCTGTTSQLIPKVRILCLDCRERKSQHTTEKKHHKKITPFFTLSEEEMKQQIMNTDMRKDKKARFLDKYTIKLKK